MALPVSRDLTFAPGTQIPSAVLNNIQDMIIGGRHGEYEIYLPPAAGLSRHNLTDLEFQFFISNFNNTAATGIFVVWPIVAPVGSALTEVKYYVENNAAASMIATLRRLALPAGTLTTIATNTTTPATSVATTITVFSTNYTFVTAEAIYLDIEKDTGGGTLCNLRGVSYKYRK
jgi:hypothetical protein